MQAETTIYFGVWLVLFMYSSFDLTTSLIQQSWGFTAHFNNSPIDYCIIRNVTRLQTHDSNKQEQIYNIVLTLQKEVIS